MNIASFLLAMVRPLLAKIFVSLGLGLITYVGVQAAFDKVVNLAVSNISGLPPQASALAGLAGIDTALGIVIGACSYVIGLSAMSRIGVMK